MIIVNFELVHYIEKELKKGFSKSQIKQVLLKSNFNEDNIDECFSYLEKQDLSLQTNPISSQTDQYQIAGSQSSISEESGSQVSSSQFLLSEDSGSQIPKSQVPESQIEKTNPTNKIQKSQGLDEVFENNIQKIRLPKEFQSRNFFLILIIILIIILSTYFLLRFSLLTSDSSSELFNNSIDNSNLLNKLNKNNQPKVYTTDLKKNLSISYYERCVNNHNYMDNLCLAIQYENVLICNDEINCYDTYYLLSSVNTNNLTFCQNITNSKMKKLCVGIIQSDLGVCDGYLDQNEKLKCQAIINHNKISCDQINEITGQKEKTHCLDDYYLFDAITKQNEQICENIKSLTQINRCKNLIIKQSQDCVDYEGCRDVGNYDVAIKTKDKVYCEKIISENMKQFCLIEV